jgi:hypothetical protein
LNVTNATMMPPDSPADNRTAAESDNDPAVVVLDSREPRDVRVAMFTQLKQDEKETILESMAEVEMRRPLSATDVN